MHYHIILTEKCNLKCKYCYEKGLEEFDNGLDKKFEFDFTEPCESKVDLKKLRKFLERDSEPVLIFYGGEPLMKIDLIKDIIDELSDLNIKFRMQTNGMLLDHLPMKYLNKIGKMLVSIDGGCKVTDKYRGRGVYSRVIKNIIEARSRGYSGEIVARMTIAQDDPDVNKRVKHLVKLIDSHVFDSVHWQLDVGFYGNDFDKTKITNFFTRYNASNMKLLKWWFKQIKKGKVYMIYPYVGIVKPILTAENEKDGGCGLRCGSGHSGYTITTSGKIVHCPIMNSMKDFQAGTLDSNPKKMKNFSCVYDCGDCDVYDLCGGRCLYWRQTKLWPKEGDDMICDSIRKYIKEIQKNMVTIYKLILKKKIKVKDFLYEDYFGPEIIP
ncbi:TIGR04084 family radical SAM/SPASM domain-containing protein [archaeon]|jgi:uncharacterized protein|nr:TIGR04084 family radical SAM/SPASM domain-containing protein [archaeon]